MERKKRDSIVLFVVLFVCFFAGIQLVCAILMVVFSLVDLFDGSYVDSVVAGLAGTAIIVAAGKIVSFLFLFFSFFFLGQLHLSVSQRRSIPSSIRSLMWMSMEPGRLQWLLVDGSQTSTSTMSSLPTDTHTRGLCNDVVSPSPIRRRRSARPRHRSDDGGGGGGGGMKWNESCRR